MRAAACRTPHVLEYETLLDTIPGQTGGRTASSPGPFSSPYSLRWHIESTERYDLLSPLTHAGPGCPPTLLLQAGHDHVVSGEGVWALQAKLQAAGVPPICVEYLAIEYALDLVLPRVSPAAQAAWTK